MLKESENKMIKLNERDIKINKLNESDIKSDYCRNMDYGGGITTEAKDFLIYIS